VARNTKSKAARSTAKQRQRASARCSHADQVRELLQWLFPEDGIFAKFQLHGNTGWRVSGLIWLALCWSWSGSPQVTDAFTQAAEWCRLTIGESPVLTYQGMMSALVHWTESFLPVLWSVLHLRMQEVAGKLWSVDGWVPIAIDGSRSSAPRSKSNEHALCAPTYGTGKTAKYRKKKSQGMRRRKNEKNKAQPQEPQAWITLLWHMSLRLPWMWRLGPSNASERAHAMDMLATGEFPQNTLFCGDAGFVGYPLWSLITQRGQRFLVRVGANVRLLTERTDCLVRCDGGRVLCWPKTAQDAQLPPLELRLVKVLIGRQRMWMLTNVVQSWRLTPEQIVNFYRLRWGIEVGFRGLKQTLDHAQLCCRNSQRLMTELHWALLGMTIAELLALKEQLALTPAAARYEPKKRSLAHTMRALRFCLQHLREVPQSDDDLKSRLRRAVTDSYVRRSSKTARYRPCNPDKKSLGDPHIRRLTPSEQKTLKTLTLRKSAA